MALVNALATLSDVKTLAGITDTTQDARLELIINNVSSQIATYCQRQFKKNTYTGEILPPSNRQLLILRNWPVVSVTSITQDGQAITDYTLESKYAESGFLYRESGWMGRGIYRSVLTDDLVAMAHNIQVTYVAGFLLPGDVGYIAGDPASLPLDLQYACEMMTLALYMQARRNNWDGLQSLTEGGLSYTWGTQNNQATNNASGLLAAHAGILSKYRRVVVTA